MEDLLLFSDIDVYIQDNMGGKFPSPDKRLRAINTELKSLRTKYNIFTTRKAESISVITDGSTAYDVSSLITSDDVEAVVNIKMTSNDGYRFTKVEEDKFDKDYNLKKPINQYTTYYENGVQKIKIMTVNLSDTQEDLTCIYLTRALGEQLDGTQVAEMTGASGEKVYLPYKYLKLVGRGAMKDLWYQATGDESQAQMAISSNIYKSELTKLGLSDEAKQIKRESSKLKLRGW